MQKKIFLYRLHSNQNCRYYNVVKTKPQENATIEEDNKLHLGADLDAELVRQFRETAKQLDLKSKRLLQRLVEWWLDQEPEVQVQMYHQLENRSMISTIIDQKLSAHEEKLRLAMNSMVTNLLKDSKNYETNNEDPDGQP